MPVQTKTIIEQKLLILDSEGKSHLLAGEIESARQGKNVQDMLPSYLNMGWQVVRMTPYGECDKILLLLQKEQVL